MTVISSERMHATSVAIDGLAVVIEGPSGSGKSDLALRLIDRGAVLIADDASLLVRQGTGLVARAPATLAGRMEVRGVGIATFPHVDEAPLGLIVRLGSDAPRMPERRQRRIAGVAVREIVLDAYHPSTPIKVELALRQPEATPQ